MAFYCLTNVKFDNSYKNGCFFSSSNVREEALHPQNYSEIKKEINFDFGRILTTSMNVKDYQNQNYCIIEYKNNYYYYFIVSADYYAVNNWKLSLELDVITQYVTGATDKTFSACNIKRAQCNRWSRTGDNVKFDVSENSQIIKHETKVDKVSKTRFTVKQKYFENDTLNNWFNTYVLCWLYVFIDCKHSYKVIGYQGNNAQITPIEYNTVFKKYSYLVEGNAIDNDYSILAFPIYKGNPKIIIDDLISGTSDYYSQAYITLDTLNDFYLKNNQNQYIYNIKLSSIPPCNFTDLQDLSFDVRLNQDLVFHIKQEHSENINKGWNTGSVDVNCFGNVWNYENKVTRNGCFVNVWQQFKDIESYDINTETRFTFSINEVKGNKNILFEPKVLLDCYNVVIRDSSNGEYNYNLLHAGNNLLKTIYTEGLNITNNNYYYRLKSTGVIPSNNEDNWNGIVNTVDYSQIVANDNISTFLSNNKNFLITKGASIGIPLLSSLSLGNISSLLNAGTETAKTVIELDNIQNRVNSLRNTNDSIILNLLVNDGLKLYIDLEKSYDLDIEAYFNYIYFYGYSINKVDNPFNYFNTRKFFNYLQFDAEYININVPSNVEDKIKTIFSNGIRLWNDYSNIYETTKENYETYLG